MFRTTTTIAAVFGLTAFAVSVASGLLSGISGPTVLGRAIAAMMLCYVIGLFVGRVGEHVAREHIKMYKAARPIPGESVAGGVVGGGAGAALSSAGGTDAAEGQAVVVG
ncbi:MAG: hypothetical protein IT435_01015 [Phycisphaerales bacterium]|nr:hypothetical protein [Phycisphaerales bacterium]